MTSANVITLANLRNDVRQMTDTENDPHISDAELNRWINRGYGDLYDHLITLFGDDFFVSLPYLLATDGRSQLYPLPPDFYKLLLAEVQNPMGAGVSGGGPAYLTLQPFALREKNKYNLVNFASYLGYLNIRYRLSGSNIMFAPIPQGGQIVQLWYAPRLIPLADTGTLTISGVTPGYYITINGITFTAVAAGAAGTQFNVGATDAATAANLATVIMANLPSPVIYAAAGPITSPVSLSSGNVLPAQLGLAANVVIVVAYNGTITWSANGGTPYTWGDQLDGVSGWEELVAIDAGLKVLGKQERDPSLLVAQKAEIKARLDRAAPNRNIGDPATVIETQGDGMFPGMSGGPGGTWS